MVLLRNGGGSWEKRDVRRKRAGREKFLRKKEKSLSWDMVGSLRFLLTGLESGALLIMASAHRPAGPAISTSWRAGAPFLFLDFFFNPSSHSRHALSARPDFIIMTPTWPGEFDYYGGEKKSSAGIYCSRIPTCKGGSNG